MQQNRLIVLGMALAAVSGIGWLLIGNLRDKSPTGSTNQSDHDRSANTQPLSVDSTASLGPSVGLSGALPSGLSGTKVSSHKELKNGLSKADLRKLIRETVDINDPLAKTRLIKANELLGPASVDYWKAYKRNAGFGTSARRLSLNGEKVLVVEDTPDGNGCNRFYDADGGHLLSLCGTEETSWKWRLKR